MKKTLETNFEKQLKKIIRKLRYQQIKKEAFRKKYFVPIVKKINMLKEELMELDS